jgi:hypothetical protein
MNKTNETARATDSAGKKASSVNIEQLAAKVYQLMLEDARLARARGEFRGTRRNGHGN